MKDPIWNLGGAFEWTILQKFKCPGEVKASNSLMHYMMKMSANLYCTCSTLQMGIGGWKYILTSNILILLTEDESPKIKFPHPEIRKCATRQEQS